MTYLVYQRELCPTTKKPHWQSYVEYKSATSRKSSQKQLGTGKHWHKKSKGTPFQAARYCMDPKKRVPDTEFYEFGERMPEPAPGKRNDLVALRDACKETACLSDLFEKDEIVPSIARFGRFAERVFHAAKKAKTRDFRKIEVIVHWGETGMGKTRQPYEEGAFKWNPQSGSEWWDGYDGEKILLIDEFYGQLTPSRLLTLLDGYQCQLPIKGGFTYAEWTKVYITCNVEPSLWYCEKVPDSVRDAIKRRITTVKQFAKLKYPADS